MLCHISNPPSDQNILLYVCVWVCVCMYMYNMYLYVNISCVFSDSDFNNTVDKHGACAACSCYDETDR